MAGLHVTYLPANYPLFAGAREAMSHRNVQVYDDVREMRYQTAVSTLLLSATTSIALACVTTTQEQTSMKTQFPLVSWASGIDTRADTGPIANDAGALAQV